MGWFSSVLDCIYTTAGWRGMLSTGPRYSACIHCHASQSGPSKAEDDSTEMYDPIISGGYPDLSLLSHRSRLNPIGPVIYCILRTGGRPISWRVGPYALRCSRLCHGGLAGLRHMYSEYDALMGTS
jgi:hypothetical protein